MEPLDNVPKAIEFLTEWHPEDVGLEEFEDRENLVEVFRDTVGVTTNQDAIRVLNHVHSSETIDEALIEKIETLRQVINSLSSPGES